MTEKNKNESPVKYPLPKLPQNHNPRCTKCGLELRPVMNYYCATPGCPSGLGGMTA